jgi:hypothetical protein
MIDRIDPIRGDIVELRHVVEAAIERSAKEQTRFVVVAFGVVFAAIVGSYSTLIALIR